MRSLFFIVACAFTTLFAVEKYELDIGASYSYTIDYGPPNVYSNLDADFSWFNILPRDDASLSGGLVKLKGFFSDSFVYERKGETLSTFDDGFSWFYTSQCPVKDEQGSPICYIEYDQDTDHEAAFNFYNLEQELFATATLDKERSHLNIFSPDGSILFRCIKSLSVDYSSYRITHFWDITRETDTPFDERILWPFISYVAKGWWRPICQTIYHENTFE